MRLVISSSGSGLDSPVDFRFGRCPYFVLVETGDRKIKSHKAVGNVSANQMGGAGMTAAQAVADMRPDAIITGNMGPRAFQVFTQLGIDVYQGNGTVREVAERLLKGELQKISGPTGPMFMGGRPGMGNAPGRGLGRGAGRRGWQ
jgi:predicted Fe-Mo cluster-binding NifX family protein